MTFPVPVHIPRILYNHFEHYNYFVNYNPFGSYNNKCFIHHNGFKQTLPSIDSDRYKELDIITGSEIITVISDSDIIASPGAH